MNWFSSDFHFNHYNIITKFVFRPFRTVEEMNREIIARHNSRVKPDDNFFFLGDFKVTTQGQNFHELKKQLNGNHIFIRGNHDKNNGCNTAINYVVIQQYGKTVVLTHKAEDAEFMMQYRDIDFAFVGHSHDVWKFKENMVNVGVDQWNFYPVDAKQIFKAYTKWNKEVEKIKGIK
jgi:calcineurin-like phosphoesterase family protein